MNELMKDLTQGLLDLAKGEQVYGERLAGGAGGWQAELLEGGEFLGVLL